MEIGGVVTKKNASMAAAWVATFLGGMLVFLCAASALDAERNRREAPLRAMLGNAVFEALSKGERMPQHYLGEDRRAPDFTLRDRNGRPWRLRDHLGKVVVLNFWTVTCAPCLEEMPSLLELGEKVRGRDDIVLVSVTTDRDPAVIAPHVPEGAPLPVLFDPNGTVVREKFGTRLFPETWIVDPRGVVRFRVDGARDWSTGIAWSLIESFL